MFQMESTNQDNNQAVSQSTVPAASWIRDVERKEKRNEKLQPWKMAVNANEVNQDKVKDDFYIVRNNKEVCVSI
jgi:hypothetical protein